MSCNCTQIKKLPTCINELVIGTIALVSQDVYVFIHNKSINHTIRLTGVSDVDGLVTVDFMGLPDNFFSENYTYEIYITATNTSPNDREDITIDTTTDSCLMVSFMRIEDESIESVYYSTVTAVIE